ncbi:MAG TPA: pitrilysin family protein [Ginsengibacter sp.]|nr:pitrilysin family protein [Ginsengibacter sp.]HRP18010.1 pitrilysin family protein [Ginsengibacter sp.]
MLKIFRLFLLSGAVIAVAGSAQAQNVKFTEYNLPNGLHVILHQDNTNPVVAVTVMYHVGSKNEVDGRTGFAHFFEHLLFEGSKNIGRGEFMKIVASHGGNYNANTTQDRTFYFESFPSNELELGLWLESERMMHPVINEIGVKTQNEVVKEEKRMRMDNAPYGNLVNVVFDKLFTNHPYHRSVIGTMEDLDAARLPEFQAFFKKYYAPGNAVLTIAGDIDIAKTKQLVAAYFGPIPKGQPVVQPNVKEAPITKEIVDTAYDANIQIPAILTAYRTPGENTRDARVLELIANYLSNGASSKLARKMVDEKKEALVVQAFNYALEDYGAYLTFALPNGATPLDTLLHEMDVEIAKVRTDLISEKDLEKLKNQVENNLVAANQSMLGVAENLANGYTFFKNTNYINEELKLYKSITREQIREVARKYLDPNSRLVLYYLPKAQGK